MSCVAAVLGRSGSGQSPRRSACSPRRACTDNNSFFTGISRIVIVKSLIDSHRLLSSGVSVCILCSPIACRVHPCRFSRTVCALPCCSMHCAHATHASLYRSAHSVSHLPRARAARAAAWCSPVIPYAIACHVCIIVFIISPVSVVVITSPPSQVLNAAVSVSCGFRLIPASRAHAHCPGPTQRHVLLTRYPAR